MRPVISDTKVLSMGAQHQGRMTDQGKFPSESRCQGDIEPKSPRKSIWQILTVLKYVIAFSPSGINSSRNASLALGSKKARSACRFPTRFHRRSPFEDDCERHLNSQVRRARPRCCCNVDVGILQRLQYPGNLVVEAQFRSVPIQEPGQ